MNYCLSQFCHQNELDTLSAELRRKDQEKTRLIEKNGALLEDARKQEKQAKSLRSKLESEQITNDTLKVCKQGLGIKREGSFRDGPPSRFLGGPI